MIARNECRNYIFILQGLINFYAKVFFREIFIVQRLIFILFLKYIYLLFRID